MKKGTKRLSSIFTLFLGLLLIGVGIYSIGSYYLYQAQRENMEHDTLVIFEEALAEKDNSEAPIIPTIIVDPQDTDWAVEGEFDGMAQEDIDDLLARNPYSLEALGIVSVPAHNIRTPVWKGYDVLALRYGAGWVPTSARPGDHGNCVILGHHMRSETVFHFLIDVQIGDTITVDVVDQDHAQYFEYTVDEIMVLNEKDFRPYMSLAADVRDISVNPNTGLPIAPDSRITLVSCTYTSNGTRRLVVRGTLSYSEY